MLEDGSLTKQTIAVLDKYLRRHNIDCQGRKKAKLNEVQRHITNHLAVTQNLREQDSDTDESEEDEVVTCDEERRRRRTFLLKSVLRMKKKNMKNTKRVMKSCT